MPFISHCVKVLGCFCLLTLCQSVQAQDHYTVSLDAQLSRMKVKLCFADKPPRRLVNFNSQQQNYLQQALAHYSQAKPYLLKPLRVVRNARMHSAGTHPQWEIRMPSGLPIQCVHYDVEFNGDVVHGWFSKRQSRQQQVLLDIHQWMWFADRGDASAQLPSYTIEFIIPQAFSISAPWPRLEKNTAVQRAGVKRVFYQGSLRPADWDARIAIGRFKPYVISRGEAQIEVAMLNARHAFNKQAFKPWLEKNLDALMMTYGEFPVDFLQLLVIPVGADTEPVPWGQAMHGGGDAVHLYIDQTRALQEFLNDWVLIHELSHLLHPRFENASWLGEGLASYYQNVLRVRGGLMSQQLAWQKLHEGFQRGIKQTPRNKTLAQVSSTMMQSRSFMRVYWSGAAISLLADFELRQQTDNRQSLDSVMRQFKHCCLHFNREWDSQSMMQKLDQLSQTNVFTRLRQRHLFSTEFPVLDRVYQQLGLTLKRHTIELDNQAVKATIRQAIMQTPQLTPRP